MPMQQHAHAKVNLLSPVINATNKGRRGTVDVNMPSNPISISGTIMIMKEIINPMAQYRFITILLGGSKIVGQ